VSSGAAAGKVRRCRQYVAAPASHAPRAAAGAYQIDSRLPGIYLNSGRSRTPPSVVQAARPPRLPVRLARSRPACLTSTFSRHRRWQSRALQRSCFVQLGHFHAEILGLHSALSAFPVASGLAARNYPARAPTREHPVAAIGLDVSFVRPGHDNGHPGRRPPVLPRTEPVQSPAPLCPTTGALRVPWVFRRPVPGAITVMPADEADNLPAA
jgi:hypothetical protein